MDFIFELPRTKDNKTGIMVVVDKLSKRIHFIPIESKHNAERTADTFYREIYKHHGLPRKIISDRDSRFTGNFWSELMKLLKVKLNLSTAFHPQTDGQSERAFRTLEDMLRCFVSYTQRDWSRFLPGLEFACNNHMNDTTRHTPFFLEYGQHPLSISDILHPDPPEATCQATANFLSNIRTATELAQTAIQEDNDRNKEIVKKTKQNHEYEVGNQFMLSTKNIPLKTGISQKFSRNTSALLL